MSLLTVVQDVCAFVGVNRPQSIFGGLNSDRTQQELLALANEAAAAIAYDEHEWEMLKSHAFIDGASEILPPPGGGPDIYNQSALPLPINFRRMLLTTNIRRETMPTIPLRFIPDTDTWAERRLAHRSDTYSGEWMIYDGYIWVSPKLPVGQRISFSFLQKNFIKKPDGTVSDNFINDGDAFLLDERLLKLAMIWRWKKSKGSPYAEDMSDFEIAKARVIGADTPAPIIVGGKTVSSYAKVAMPWPPDWGPQP